ncbi:alpha/beta fold hydrolase [Amycolatopsis sp. CA-230715]|uniref:alpha/beta fold hydrolase n=1 Tax=Amycolatopsis sp. CA-230715 TaxID=2745196 RepID=UPI001C011F23|nr:alpha/beta fold hydrolase [Amycolatopsis sp. CA-230715]QWF83803.1 Pyrethroid hydrolase [Amycolatopsis sp. CA-230715]
MNHTFLLVHARWHGAWCWDRVADLLRRDGHEVLVPDRLGFAQLTALLEAQDRPVPLVGHSSSGMTISALAELLPDRVHLLAYATAFLLPGGETPREVIGADTESILTEHLVTDERTGLVTVRAPEEVFFGACTAEDAAWAAKRLVPEPAGPPDLPAVALTAERFGRVPRVYLECLADRALGPSAQRRMYTATPCRAVYRLPADHAPFLSAPRQLAEALANAT